MGFPVRIFDNFSTGRESNIDEIKSDVEIIRGDFTNLSEIKKAVEGVQIVFHQGALPSVPRSINDPLASHHANVTGTLHVLIAAKEKGVRRVVYASSSSVYGDTEILPKIETMTPNPKSPYALTKLAGEYYCRIFHQIYGIETVSLRYFNVFGPRQNPESPYAAVIPKFIRAIMKGEPPVIFGDGEQSRDFTYVENVVRANLLAAQVEDAAGKTFNIACGGRVTVRHLAVRIAEILGVDIRPIFTDPRPGDVRHSQADIELARKILKYEPTILPDEGLIKTIAWYQKEESCKLSQIV